ncbi:Battenin [Aphelenchoides besseyi]|nr:Battenin [Aphelenchoides besseyi]
MMRSGLLLPDSRNNLIAFWLFGLFNNFAYVVMLSAAKDILEPNEHNPINGTNISCIEDRSTAKCSQISTGAVLLADIIPSLVIKIITPFVFTSIAYNVRQVLVIALQFFSFVVVATSNTAFIGLSGVVLASLGSGLGDVTMLALSSHFPSNVISSWSSGTGGAGVIGAVAYAFLTDKSLVNMTPRHALLSMLVVPWVFAFTFFYLLRAPFTVYKANLWQPSTYFIPSDASDFHAETSSLHSDNPERRLLQDSEESSEEEAEEIEDIEAASGLTQKFGLIKPLLKYMIPLCVVYFAEYFINYGLLELLIFDCNHGFRLSQTAQYRWYNVLYQIGVFISRTSVGVFTLSLKFMPVLAVLQMVNAFAFAQQAMLHYYDHIAIAFVWILYEGVLGGTAYAHTFHSVHTSIPRRRREFSLAFVTMSDSIGILIAGLSAIPAHNFICSRFFN